jgi:hypothetical protein
MLYLFVLDIQYRQLYPKLIGSRFPAMEGFKVKGLLTIENIDDTARAPVYLV